MRIDRSNCIHEDLWDFIIDYNKYIKNNIQKKDGNVKIKLFREVAQYKEGNVFGERALLNNQRRAARIVTNDICFFGILDKIEYQKIIGVTERF